MLKNNLIGIEYIATDASVTSTTYTNVTSFNLANGIYRFEMYLYLNYDAEGGIAIQFADGDFDLEIQYSIWQGFTNAQIESSNISTRLPVILSISEIVSPSDIRILKIHASGVISKSILDAQPNLQIKALVASKQVSLQDKSYFSFTKLD